MSTQPPPTPRTGDRLRFALVGAGVIGTHHGKVSTQLADRIELAAVVDVELDRAEKLAAERGGKAFASLTEALAALDIDVVVVCTPTGRHGEVAIEALVSVRDKVIQAYEEIMRMPI